MAITCALGPKHIDALAKAIYKKMSTLPQGEVFDINGYMDYLYKNIAEKQGKDSALQYMQQFPYLANIIAAKLVDVDIDPSVNLRTMAKEFRNPDTGWEAVNARFNTELTPEAIDALSDYEANTPSQESFDDEISEPVTKLSDDRLKATTALSGTLEQFVTMDPRKKVADTEETPDPEKNYIKLAIAKIRNASRDMDINASVNYQGKFLRYKVVNLKDFPRDERTKQTDDLIGTMVGIPREETISRGITPIDELFALIITDEAGNTIYFDQQGNVTTKQNGGKPVYQMMRDVRLENGRYSVKDIYNQENQIISPEDAAENTIRKQGYKSFPAYEKATGITREQLIQQFDEYYQDEFKQLYDLKQKAIKGKAPLLYITGASVGILNTKILKNQSLNTVMSLYPNVMDTFTVLSTGAFGFGDGRAIITIDGTQFEVDRADVPRYGDLATKIAQVLQADNISNEDKILYYNQFFNDEVINEVNKTDLSFVTSIRRHKLVKSKSGKPFFVYANYTNEEIETSKRLLKEFTDKYTEKQIQADPKLTQQLKELTAKTINNLNYVPLDGTQKSIDKIKEVLLKGKSSFKNGVRTYYGAKLNYMRDRLTNDYYDYVDGKLVKAGIYKDFIISLNPTIIISNTKGLPLFNSYITFSIPDNYSNKAAKAQEKAAEDSRSAIRKFKDDMVEVVKNAPAKSIKIKVINVIEKQYPDKRPSTYNYDAVIEGQEGKHRFYGAQSRVNMGDTYYLTVEDVIDNGFLYKDTVKARVDSKKSGALDMGSLGERDFKTEDSRGIPVETITAAETEQAEALDELTPQPNTLPEDQVQTDQQQYVNPSNTVQPSDSTPIGRRFKRDYTKFLDRSADLPNEVTQAQIDAATTWWNNSPLSKFISLEHVANIVNSNVYARFIAAGSSLLAEQNLDGKLGKILINEATKGSMVDTYHEAWHVFSQLFLTREEKLKLYNEVRNSDPKFNNLSARAIEEILAEDFRTYALSPKTRKGAPVRNTLFRRILNFLKKLLTGKQSLADQIQPEEISTYGVAGELFNKLFFASNKPELLNDFTPLIDNVQWDVLNRGVRRTDNFKEDALNDRDSLDLVNALDSLISEEIDNSYAYNMQYNAERNVTKSGVVNILLQEDKRDQLYDILKEEIQDRVNEIQDRLTVKPAVLFNSFNTVKEISDNAIAVIKNSKGDDEYFFLKDQIEDFSNLNLDDKKGQRIKGEIYEDSEVIGDFYTHTKIKGTDKNPINIVIVNSLEEAKEQFDAYSGKSEYTEIIENPNATAVQTTLDFGQQQDLERLRIFQTALRNWKSVIKFHKENSDFNIINKKVAVVESDPGLDPEEATNDLEDAAGGEKFKDSVGELTLQQLADNEVIYMLKSLFARKKEGDTYVHEYDRLGFKKRANFKKVWNAIVRTTNGEKDPQKIYEKIVKASSIYPEFQQLVEYKLPNPSVEDPINGTSFSITTSFWNAFSLPRIKYMQLLVSNDREGITTEVTNTSMDIGTTRRKFIGQFKAQKPNKFIVKDKFNRNILNLNAIVQEFIDPQGKLKFTDDAEFKFLRTIGFKYDDLAKIKEELRDPKNRQEYSIEYIFKAVKELRDAQVAGNLTEDAYKILNDFRANPLDTLRRGFPKGVIGLPNSIIYIDGLKLGTAVNRLIELQNRYGSTASNFSVLNAAKKRVNEHTTDNTLTVITDAINSAENKTDLFKQGSITSYLDPRRNPWTNNLQTFNTLFDATNKKREGRSIAVEMASGTQIAGQDGATTTDLDPRSKFIQEFHTMLKSGMQEILRPGSKSSSFAWRIDGGIEWPGLAKKVNKHLYIDFDIFLNLNKELDAIEKIILPYVSSEVARINIFKTNPNAKNYIGYNKPGRDGKPSGEQFNYFDGILTDTTKKEILSKVNTTEVDLLNYITTDPLLKEKILKEVQAYFQTKSQELYDYLQEGKYVDPKEMARYNLPEFTGAQKENLLMKAYMYNSWIHNVETSVIFYGDIAQYDHTKQDFHKRTSGLISNGRRFRTDIAAIKYINDVFNASGKTYASTLDAKYNKFSYNGSLNTAIIQEIKRDSVYLDDIRDGLTKFYTERTNMSADQIKKTVDREVEKYTKDEIKEGDGQGYITFDAYRTLKKLQNKWSDKQEELFQKIINGEPITEPLDEFFPVYKLQNFSFLDNTVLPVTGFHKFALFPLIPSVIKQGSDLDKMHKSMLEQNIQYLTFDSGSKGGAITSDGKPDKAIDENGRFNESVVFTKNTFNAGFLKEVTNVPKKYKGKVVFSTQLRKLILDGLYEEGILTMPKYSGLVKAYEDNVAFNTELLKTELMEEIGYVEGKGVTQPEKFLKVIKETLQRKDYPEHLLRALKTNSDGSLKYDLSYFLDAQTIEDTIMSIVEKKFVRQKVKGEALVQVASSFTNNMWTAPSQEDVKKYMGSNTLPFYHPGKDGKTNAMKVAIAMQGDFFKLYNLNHLDGQPIGTIERLNEMIKNDEWLNTDNNRKAITMTSVRIPVQGLNSMEFMEVYEFLDPAAGSIIIVPTEIVAKSGGDFDVDKLTTFMPNLDDTGNVITSNMSKEQFFAAYAKASDSDKKEMMKLQKKAVENSFIDNIRGILEIPENYATLVRPNDTALLQDLATELEDKVSDFNKYLKVNGESTNLSGKGKRMISPTTVLEQRYNVAKHGHNIIGKAVLGIGASENAMNPVFNQSGVILPKKYKKSTYKNELGTFVEEGDPIYDMRLFMPHNKTKDGNISLSKITDVNGVDRIADVVSQGMNGWVDVEKDEWVFYIQGNYELAPTMLYLIRAGVPREYAVKFMSSPFIREYAEELRKIQGPFAQAMGTAASGKPFEIYEATKRVLERHMLNYMNQSLGMLNPNDEITVSFKVSKKKTTKTKMPYSELQKNVADGVYDLSKLQKVTIDISGKERELYVKPSVDNDIFYDASTKANERYLETGYPIELMDTLIDKYSKGEPFTSVENSAAIGMLLHFSEIQKQIRGIGKMKRRGKPDTTLFRNIQEIILRDLDIDALDNDSKVDKASKDKVLKESITSSLGDKRIIVDVVSQVLPLRNGSLTNSFIQTALSNPDYRIPLTDKFGSSRDGLANFVSTFKNNISNFILQNYLSNFIDPKGNIVEIPQDFKGMPVKLSKNLSTDVEIKDGVVYVNDANIRNDFENKNYLDTAVGPRSYAQRPGLEAFKSEQDPFPSRESYVKYAIFRSYMQNEGYTGLELNKIALLNAFNFDALMRNNDFSYTNEVMDVIDKYPNLAVEYPILEQISILSATAATNYNVLTLSDRDVIDGTTKNNYATYIRALANPRIQKVADPVENLRISRLFHMLPLVAVYQHGVGSTLYGFDQVLPQDMIQEAMQNASNLFKLNYWNLQGLSSIFNKTISEDKQFKNFVLTEEEFNNGTPLRAVEAAEDPFEAIDNEPFFAPQLTVRPSSNITTKKNIFSVIPQQGAVDKKAAIKASIATQYIGFGEGLRSSKGQRSSTEIYREQAGEFANTGNYSSDDVIFVSIPGRRGAESKRKEEQDKTIREAIKAVEAGATILTDNKAYTDASNYNTGEKRLYANMESKGYNYSEVTVDGQTIGTWSKATTQPTVKPVGEVKEGVTELFESNSELASIGTPEQYSQYLDTIFPDSKVKDIVYHFSNVKIDKPNKEKFSLSANINRRRGFFGISENINPGNNFANVEGTIPHAMLFDMKNPDFGDFSVIPPVTAKDETKDSAIIKQRGGINYYAVFEPEQIHILGAKQDIEGFKEFVTTPSMSTVTQTPIEAKTTDQYRYFGSMYTIKLQDGIGVDVEGYKGKAAAKAKLLDAYNADPNIDPQNGRPFRQVASQLDVQSNNTDQKFVFADGTAIPVPFKLNPEQEAALYKLEDFYNNPGAYDNEITLSGYAGTGKTTILGIFDKYINKKSFVAPIYTSPTHRANAVTKMKNPGAKVSTLHSLFGLNPLLNLETDELDVRNVKTEKFRDAKIKRRNLIIVDEASMVTNDLYDLIQDFKKDMDLRIIYAGDKGQLGPVQNDTKLESKVFDNANNQIQLTKVERTGDNPILLNSTRAREGKDFTYISDEVETNGVEFFNTPNRLNQVMGQNLKEMKESGNMLYFRILSSLNKDVARINLQARDIIFGEEAQKSPYIKGDVLMGYDNVGKIINSGDYVVEDVSELQDIVIEIPKVSFNYDSLEVTGIDKVIIKGYKLSVRDILDAKEVYEVNVPGEGNDAQLIEIAKKVLELKSYYPKAFGRARGQLYSYIDSVNQQLLLNKDVVENGRFLAKKAIDYGYAHTIHKSQGGTYNKVLIFDDSITALSGALASKRGLGLEGRKAIEDQLKYVAISRASEYAYVYNEPSGASEGQYDFTEEPVVKITEEDADTAAIATYSFASPETATPQVQTKGEIEMRSDNVTKIFSGNKTVTNRTSLINDGKYTIKNSTDVVELKYIGKSTIDGNQVTIVNEKTGVVSTRTLDQLAKAEGFKDAADFRTNNKFSTNYLNGTQSRYLYQVSPVSAVSVDSEASSGRIPETNTDLQDYKDAVAKNNGVFPDKLTTSAGRLYVLNSDGLYNLVDPVSGILLMKNIDLNTGEVGLPNSVNVPATTSYKNQLLNQIEVLRENYNLEDLLGQYGYDIRDLIEKVQNAETVDQVDDVASLINEKICK